MERPSNKHNEESHNFGAHYRGCHIFEMGSMPRQENPTIPQFPTRINSTVVAICKQGDATINVNMNRYKVHDNTVFFNGPNSLIHIEEMNEENHVEEGAVMVINPEMGSKLDFDIKELMPLALKIKDNHVVSIPPEECDILLQIIRSISREIQRPESEPFYHEVLKNYIELFFYKLCNIVGKTVQANTKYEKSVKNRSEEYFHRFVQLLSENYKRERTLGFYADELCITPKYLTTLIKKVSGRSASEWIDSYVVLEAKNLLRYTSMSIQEVAYELNFPNQSFFGKYFKHQTGYSPSAYKMLK